MQIENVLSHLAVKAGERLVVHFTHTSLLHRI